jgi:hypothetical protein
MKAVVLALSMLLACVCGKALAQIESGPAAGAKVEPLKVVIAAGGEAGSEADIAERRKGETTVYLFVQADKWDRPVARFVRTLDEEVSNKRSGVTIYAIWLTKDVEESKSYLPRAEQSLRASQTTYCVFPGDINGPAGWAIDSRAHLTAVVVADEKVTASFGYRSVNETDIPAVMEKIPAK